MYKQKLQIGCKYECAIDSDKSVIVAFTGRFTRNHKYPIFVGNGGVEYSFPLCDVLRRVEDD